MTRDNRHSNTLDLTDEKKEKTRREVVETEQIYVFREIN